LIAFYLVIWMSYFGRDLAWKFKKHVLKPWASEYRTSYIFYQRYLFQWLKYDLSFQNHCCAGSTLWPLQKCLHYIIVEFPLHHSFYPPNPNSWNSFKRSRVPFNIWPLHVNQPWSSSWTYAQTGTHPGDTFHQWISIKIHKSTLLCSRK
jgi:hypothetical protein